VPCGPFGPYPGGPTSSFMTLELGADTRLHPHR
jgi:hypothetical protein